MRIGTVARNAGVGVETVRFYEREGLVARPPRPANGGFRDYPPEIVDRIRLIRQAQGLGFSLREIDGLLSLKADPQTDCGAVRARARKKLAEVDRKIARLNSIRRALRNLIAACPGEGVATRCCSILDALEPDGAGASPTPVTKETGP